MRHLQICLHDVCEYDLEVFFEIINDLYREYIYEIKVMNYTERTSLYNTD